MKKPNITAIIIAQNESEMIQNCIDTLRWCSEILVVDDGSIDDTPTIVENAGARLVSFKSSSFKRLREEAQKHVRTDWIVYIDADERVLPTLAKELLVSIETDVAAALSIRRKNIHFGIEMEHGGWENDWVTRAFKTSALKGWHGDIHESPTFEGEVKQLNTRLLHLTHRNTISSLQKTSAWTPMEAQQIFEATTDPISFKTIIRKGFMEFFRRGILSGGYKDGTAGLVEACTQGINRMLVYMQVWEMQQQPSLEDRYKKYEDAIHQAWKEGK